MTSNQNVKDLEEKIVQNYNYEKQKEEEYFKQYKRVVDEALEEKSNEGYISSEDENGYEYYDKVKIEESNRKFFLTKEYSRSDSDSKEGWKRKILSNRWTHIVDWSINQGNNHFAITINYPNISGKEDFPYDEIGDKYYNELQLLIKKVLFGVFPTATWVFIVAEKNKKGMIHFHVLFAVRNFIDYNYTLKNNVLQALLRHYDDTGMDMWDTDIKVESLRYFKDIKNWAIYMYKDMYNWKYESKIYVLEQHWQDPFRNDLGNVTYYYLYINCGIYGVKTPHNDIINNINGVILNKNEINQGVLIDLVRYYLVLNSCYVYNDCVYKKIEGASISYKHVGSVDEILYTKFMEHVVPFFLNNYEYYFTGFDFSSLAREYLENKRNSIKEIKILSSNKIDPDFSLIEFNDGVYSIKYDRFFPRNSEGCVFNYNISTIKYYNKPYGTVRRQKPENWLRGLLKSLGVDSEGYESNERFKIICLYLINVLHKDLLDKKKTLHIWGESNTGKTTLIVDLLTNYFGIENIGTIVGGSNFKYQDLEGKRVGILDEFKYSPKNSSEFLKLTGGELLITSKKYSKQHIHIKNTPIFALGNTKIEDKDNNINDALVSRISSVEFINKLKNTKGLKKKIKQEEANIIIYINKLLFKFNKVNNKMYNEDIKRVGNKISNEEILELINYKL